MRGSGELDAPVILGADGVDCKGSAGEIAGQFLQPLGLMVQYQLLGVEGKPRRVPFHQLVHELLGKTLSAVEPMEEQVSEALFDRSQQGAGRHRQGQKLALRSEDPFG